MLGDTLLEAPLLMAVAVVAALAALVLIRGTWATWWNFVLFCFFVAMSAISGTLLLETLAWRPSGAVLALAGFTVAMVVGALSSIVALIREDAL